MAFIQYYVIAFLCLLSFSNGLTILFVLPCYGGHFGTMTPLIVSLSYSHNVTVIGSAGSCGSKLEPFRKIATFDFIEPEKEIAWGDLEVDGFIDMFRFLWTTVANVFKEQLGFLKEFLSKNPGKYDVMVTDLSFDGSLVVAEITGTPAVVLMTATPGRDGLVKGCLEIYNKIQESLGLL